ncbi:MAG: hypothetical protein JO262_20605, partial [Solirubrobacterales bacterium]|nr:hypothetical protein [Solirubrobacterales bacterium]
MPAARATACSTANVCATACSTTNVVALVRLGESGGGTRPYFSVVAAEIERDQSFGSQDPFSVGVEEELFLVDPITGRQINSSAAVLERLGKVSGKVERELHACQV